MKTARPWVPERPTLGRLATAAQECRGCELYKRATQVVFGEGPRRARLFLVGEQPGDSEDRAGHPFVGAAGRVLDEALAAAEIDRSTVYVTNMVKHFKWEPSGKRRIHKKPGAREITACRPWLEAELELLQPEAVICLGATAAQGFFGPAFRVTKERGKWMRSPLAERVLATVHPSSILRMLDPRDREEAMQEFISDLHKAAELVKTPATV